MNQDRRHVAHELDELKARLLAMGGVAEDHLRMAMRGLVERNSRLLADVIAGDSRIDDFQMEVDNRCFTLIALHQPVALDLRTLVSAPRISADLERVGDLAVNISEVAERYLRHPPVKPLIDLPRMGDLALRMLRESLDAFLSGDVTLAKTVLRQDDWLDALKDQVFREVLTHMLGDPQTIEPGVDLILMSRHLERVGDHATSIAEMSFSSSRRETFAIIPPGRSPRRMKRMGRRSNAGRTRACFRCDWQTGRLREWPIQDRRHAVYAAVDGTS